MPLAKTKKSAKYLDMTDPAKDDCSFEALGRRIRIARLRRNIAIWEVALETGFNRNTIAALEHGHEGTSVAVLWAVLRFFHQEKIMATIADPDDDFFGKAEEGWRRGERALPYVRPYKR